MVSVLHRDEPFHAEKGIQVKGAFTLKGVFHCERGIYSYKGLYGTRGHSGERGFHCEIYIYSERRLSEYKPDGLGCVFHATISLFTMKGVGRSDVLHEKRSTCFTCSGGTRIPQTGTTTPKGANCCRKLHERKNLEKGARVFGAPPPGSATNL